MKTSRNGWIGLAAVAGLLIAACTAWGATYTWDGGGANALASNPTNWVGDVAPVAGADILLDATTNKNMTWNTNLTLSSWTQVGYAGTVTVSTVYSGAFTNLTITGDCVISNGVWRHNGNTTTQANKLDVLVGGSFVLGSNATINADFLGFTSGRGASGTRGPGGGTDYYGAGSYGGRGGNSSGPTYGSITAPVDLGSACYDYDTATGNGGGAIRLRVNSNCAIEGVVTANGRYPTNPNNSAGASGGSIFITAGTFSGGGTLRANANNAGFDADGGGGRIAVVLTNGTTFGTVKMTSYGGAGTGAKGAAGTIYLQTKDQEPANGTLIVDNTNVAASVSTEISSLVTNAVVGDVLIRNGRLRVNASQTLAVSGVWSNSATFSAAVGGAVRFVGTNTSRIYSNTVFDTLICTNAGKRLEFAAGSSNSVTTALTLTGDATSNLFLRSTSNGNQWKINAAAAVNPSLYYVDVMDSDARPGKKLVAVNSVGAAQNNLNWSFANAGETNTWTGTVSTDWSASGNWNQNRPPIADDRVIIASGTYNPILPSAQTVNNLEIQNGAALRLNGYGLTVNQSAMIAGALIASNTETVVFKGNTDFTGGSFTSATSTVIIGGTNAQAITPAGNTFYTVRVTNTAGVVTFANAFTTTFLRSESASVTYGGNLTATEARMYSTAGIVTQTFNAASTYAIRDLSVPVSGANGISLRSSLGGSAWLLNVSRSAFVRNATVQDSNADGGILIHAMNSTGVSGNSNWDFGGTWGLWTGGTSTSFTNALNWSPAVAPGASTRVVIDGGYGANAPVIATAVSIRQLVLGLEQTSALTANAALTVGEDVTVGGFGTLTLNQPSAVSSNVTVLAGGTMTHSLNGRVDLAAGGNLAVDAGGLITADAKGYASGRPGAGPAPGSADYTGGSHGGRGGNASGTTYGSVIAPTNYGMGGHGYATDGYGGGAIRLAVAGTTTVNGIISARGTIPVNQNWTGAGAGGSIFLTTASLAGTGRIRADGGPGDTAGANGGGGRVAVILTNANDFGAVVLSAYGNNTGNQGNSAAGTVYLQTKDQGPGNGTLIVNNANIAASVSTEISSLVTNAVVGDVLIRNGGRLRVNASQTLTVGGSWSNSATFSAAVGGAVNFIGTNTSRIYGSSNTVFDTLICTNPGKRLEFAAGSSNSVTTALTFTGDATSNLFLRSTSDGNPWKINVAAAVNPTLSYLDVRDSDANPGKKLVALNSVGPLQNNLNWDFGSAGQTNTWTGAMSSDWATPGNWSQTRAPIAEDARVIIPSVVPNNYPILPSAQTFNNLEILGGASLRLNGFGLTVNQSAMIAGTLIASNTETVVFKGDTDFTGGTFTPASSTVIIGGTNAQVITPAANTFYTVRVTNTAGVVTFANAFATTFLRSESASVTYGGNLTATEARLYSTGGTVTQTFNAASTYAIRDLVVPVSGANGISLRSSNSGSAWLLNVSRSAFVRNATVQDSNADGGILIHAMNSTDVSGNSNWDFGGTWGLWTGGTSTSFTNALNWSPAVAPDASTRVVIDGGYGANAPVIATAASIRQLVLGTEQASALTANAPLTVGEDVTVGGFGTLTLNRPSTVSNNVTVLTGGRTMHGDNGTTEANKLNLAIGGNLVLDTGADIYADGKGYDSNQGTGSPSAGSYRYAGSYGGRGGIGGGSGTNGPTYGSILAPTNCGSGGYGYNAGADGGGAIRLAVSGNTTLNGTITANGNPIPGNATGAGAGGSIWLTTANLSGSGTIRARGGAGGNNNGDNGGGGGGRIAVILANGTTFGSVAMQAYGGVYSNLNGGAGTIYRQTAGQPNGAGTVTIDNGNQPAALTQIPPATNAVPDELKKVSLVVTNRGAMAVTTNAMVEALTVVSTNELLNLGTSNTVLTVKALNVNGTNYTRQGFYMTNNWNDYTPVPVNVTGAGSISLIGMKGTVFTLR